MPINDISSVHCQRGLIVSHELKETVGRLRAEGFTIQEISAGIGSMANDVIASGSSQAAASAWFFGMAKLAAQLAADELDRPN